MQPALHDEPPIVSVIIPVHNVGPLAGQAIASLKDQTLTGFEALVIDDGSTDDSAVIAEKAIAGDPRFRLIRQSNGGLSAARNAGLDLARGRWIAFLDGDDRYLPPFLAQLIRAAQDDGLPWAAAGIALCHADGRQIPHSAIHGSPDPAGMAKQVFALEEATEVARHFPSAWNKVYRRDLLDGLRFRHGTWFEDHEFYWACADRARSLLHLPDALYLHRRDRAGQITASNDERVFDLFGVLDHLRPLVQRFARAEQGFARLATRLVLERAQVLPRGDRRERFLDCATNWLAAQGLAPDHHGAPDLSLTVSLRLTGKVPVSVIVPVPPEMPPDAPALRANLAAIHRGPPWEGEVVVLRAEEGDLTAAAGRCHGACIMIVPPGAEIEPGGITALAEAALRTDTELTLGTVWRGAGHHDGWTDNRLAPPAPTAQALPGQTALRLYPSVARALIRRDLLLRAGSLSVPPWSPMAEAELVLRLAGQARSVACIPDIVARIPLPDRSGIWQVVNWAAGLPECLAPGDLTGWRAVLVVRHLQAGLPRARSLHGLSLRLWAAALIRLRGLGGGKASGERATADPGTDPWLRRLSGLKAAPD